MNSLDPNPRKFLGTCIAISLGVHALFLTFVQAQSLWFYSRVEIQQAEDSWSSLLEAVPRDQILKEAFSHNTPSAPPLSQPQEEQTSFQFTNSSPQIKDPPLLSISIATPPIDELLSRVSPLFPVHSFPIPATSKFDFFADISKDLILPTTHSGSSTQHFSLITEQLPPLNLISPAVPHSKSPPEPLLEFSSPASFPTPPQDIASLPKSALTIPLPRLPQLPSLLDLSTVNLSEAFEAELTFLPRPEGTGYLFALTLIPKADLELPKIRQLVTFLIDRSNSIQRERLNASKQAVIRALEELDKEDYFNIIVFDNKIEKFSPMLISPTPDAISKAETFLDKINLGSFFSTSDLYKPLLLTIPGFVKEDELYSTILLTDGESLTKKQSQQGLLNDWTLQNKGRVSLYAVGMENDPSKDKLETICILNRGNLVESTTQRGLKRKLLKLAKTIRSPVAKNLTIKAISRAPNTNIQIHPTSSIAPHLYLDQPYVILGTTETLDDFIIFVQGRLKDKWLNIKKPISFLHAKNGGNSLKVAYRNFEKFSLDVAQSFSMPPSSKAIQ